MFYKLENNGNLIKSSVDGHDLRPGSPIIETDLSSEGFSQPRWDGVKWIEADNRLPSDMKTEKLDELKGLINQCFRDHDRKVVKYLSQKDRSAIKGTGQPDMTQQDYEALLDKGELIRGKYQEIKASITALPDDNKIIDNYVIDLSSLDQIINDIKAL